MEISVGRNIGKAVDWPQSAGMVAILGTGLFLASISYNHPAHASPILPWEFSWSEYLSIVVACWWYLLGMFRMPVARRPSWGRRASYGAGLVLIYAVLQTRFEYVAQHMFFLHRIQHLVLHHLGPFLIAYSWPGEVLRSGAPLWMSRVIHHRSVRLIRSALQRPIPAAILFVGFIFLWLFPPVHIRAMLNPGLYAIVNWSMVVDGIVFFILVLDPRPDPPSGLSYSYRLVLALSVQIPQIALGGVLVATTVDAYPWYDLCGRILPWINALTDQQIAGSIIIFPGGMMSAVTALIIFRRLWRAEERDEIAGTPV